MSTNTSVVKCNPTSQSLAVAMVPALSTTMTMINLSKMVKPFSLIKLMVSITTHLILPVLSLPMENSPRNKRKSTISYSKLAGKSSKL